MEEQLAADGQGALKAKTLPTAAELVLTSQEFLDDVRNGSNAPAAIDLLARLDEHNLAAALNTDAARKAFWINTYNACNLLWIPQDSDWSLMARIRHFFKRRLRVGDTILSLNDIEHRILRKSRIWWARGWLRNPFPRAWEKRLRVAEFDPRIHFALNCGANGCPAIRHYTIGGIESELEQATAVFVEFESWLEGNELVTSEIFRMYLGDFGGKRKLLIWLRNYLPGLKGTERIRFRSYDWTLNLDKWSD